MLNVFDKSDLNFRDKRTEFIKNKVISYLFCYNIHI